MKRDRVNGNRFVAALPEAVFGRLAPDLKPVTLKRGMPLAAPGDSGKYVYFPDSGIVSLIKTMRDGRTAEVGVVGREGMAGVGMVFGIPRTAFDAVVQVDGEGHRIDTAALRAEMDASPAVRGLALRYLSYRLAQLAQTAACNRLHTLRQRCCRWLLTAEDNVQAERFVLTHEFLALMMGVNRPGVSLTAAALRRKNIIRYRHATITIVDRPALEEFACECYTTMRDEAEKIYRA